MYFLPLCARLPAPLANEPDVRFDVIDAEKSLLIFQVLDKTATALIGGSNTIASLPLTSGA